MTYLLLKRKQPLTKNYCGILTHCTPDSHGGYWVSPVKMMPKLLGITHQITYYSTTKSTTNMDGAI